MSRDGDKSGPFKVRALRIGQSMPMEFPVGEIVRVIPSNASVPLSNAPAVRGNIAFVELPGMDITHAQTQDTRRRGNHFLRTLFKKRGTIAAEAGALAVIISVPPELSDTCLRELIQMDHASLDDLLSPAQLCGIPVLVIEKCLGPALKNLLV